MKRSAKMLISGMSLAVLALCGCGSTPKPEIKVIEQVPQSTPSWVSSGKACNQCKDVNLEEGQICFVGRSSNQTSLDKAREAASVDGTRKIVSYFVGDLVDREVETIMDGENSSPEDRTTVDMAMTVVTLGETGGFVQEGEHYERTYYWNNQPDAVIHDAQLVFHVDAGTYADKLADKLEEQAKERRDEVRVKLQKRADQLRQMRWDQMNNGQ